MEQGSIQRLVVSIATRGFDGALLGSRQVLVLAAVVFTTVVAAALAAAPTHAGTLKTAGSKAAVAAKSGASAEAVQSPSPLPVIDIKGIAVGMNKVEVDAKLGAPRDFTIAGVPSKYSGPSLRYGPDQILDTFIFFFYAGRFDDVVDALKSKYPTMKCLDSDMQTKGGGHFKDTTCELDGANGAHLHMTRFVGDIETSSLMMQSERAAKEAAEEREKRLKDI